MDNLKDKDYVLSFSKLDEYGFEHSKEDLKFHGFHDIPINGKNCRVYNPLFYTIINNDEIEVLHRGAGEPFQVSDGRTFHNSKPEIVEGAIFLDSYVIGFQKGLKDLEDIYRITPSSFGVDQWRMTIEKLHMLYYHTKRRGWRLNYWATSKQIDLMETKIVSASDDFRTRVFWRWNDYQQRVRNGGVVEANEGIMAHH